jgi:hypothetical protein
MRPTVRPRTPTAALAAVATLLATAAAAQAPAPAPPPGQSPAPPAAAPAPQPPAASAEPCALPELRQFDFWLGEWELVSRYRQGVSWTEEKATDRVRRVLNGCALLQEWRGTVAGQPVEGISLTSYAPGERQWQQAWSDDSGPTLYVFTGGLEGDRMVLSRPTEIDGKPAVRRQVFYNIRPDRFDWVYEQSADGANWTPLWKIHYTRKR